MPEAIHVYTMPGNGRIATISPFGLKLETWLRMFGVPYEHHDAFFQQSPNGHLPFAEHAGERITDSSRIIAYAKRLFGVDPDAGLGPEQRALATLVTSGFEDCLRFVHTYDTFVDDDAFAKAKAYVCQFLPPEMHEPVTAAMRAAQLDKLQRQGTSLLTRDEVHGKAFAIVDAAAQVLGDKPFMLGAQPTTVDATVYGVLVAQLRGVIDSPLSERICSHANLIDLVQRIDGRYWA